MIFCRYTMAHTIFRHPRMQVPSCWLQKYVPFTSPFLNIFPLYFHFIPLIFALQHVPMNPNDMMCWDCPIISPWHPDGKITTKSPWKIKALRSFRSALALRLRAAPRTGTVKRRLRAAGGDLRAAMGMYKNICFHCEKLDLTWFNYETWGFKHEQW